MKWTTEARLLRAIAVLPFGESLHYFAQHRISGSFPISDERLDRERRYAREHLAALDPGTPLTSVSALEFGAGRHLAVSMVMLAAGVRRVTAMDVSRLMRPELVRDAAARLGDSELGRLVDAEDVLAELVDVGLHYHVTAPSSFAGVPDDSVDLVFSTSVLEHVPEEQIGALFSEARRVLNPGGRLSLIVDYKDHFSYSDQSLPRLHFLSVPRELWFTRFSPSNHFQNRLRHHQVVQSLLDAGFDVEVKRKIEATLDDLEWLASTPLDRQFAAMPPQLTGVGEAHLVARLPA